MHTLLNQQGHLCGYLFNSKFLLPDNFVVGGVLLGHCAFGQTGAIKGRYFDHTLYSISGDMVCKAGKAVDPLGFDLQQTANQAWQVIRKIEDHHCPWVQPTGKWHPDSLSMLLRAPAAIIQFSPGNDAQAG